MGGLHVIVVNRKKLRKCKRLLDNGYKNVVRLKKLWNFKIFDMYYRCEMEGGRIFQDIIMFPRIHILGNSPPRNIHVSYPCRKTNTSNANSAGATPRIRCVRIKMCIIARTGEIAKQVRAGAIAKQVRAGGQRSGARAKQMRVAVWRKSRSK